MPRGTGPEETVPVIARAIMDHPLLVKEWEKGGELPWVVGEELAALIVTSLDELGYSIDYQ